MAEPSAHIPVIDISPSNADAARQIFKAASTNGFVYIENNRSTGISPAQIAEMFALVSSKEEEELKKKKRKKKHKRLCKAVDFKQSHRLKSCHF
jgi:isopenicillin N synthase-like dioxygenase